jgi:hypothetical protein
MGFLVASGIATYWGLVLTKVLDRMKIWDFNIDAMVYEDLLLPVDLTASALIILASFLLFFSASAPPIRMLTSDDIYAGSGRSSTRKQLLEVNDTASVYADSDMDATPLALYKRFFERTGMANPRCFTGRAGRFLMHIGLSVLLAAAIAKIRYFTYHRIWHYAPHDVVVLEFCVAGLAMLLAVTGLPVLFFVDPGRVPPPPPEADSGSNLRSPSLSFLSDNPSVMLSQGQYGSNGAYAGSYGGRFNASYGKY